MSSRLTSYDKRKYSTFYYNILLKISTVWICLRIFILLQTVKNSFKSFYIFFFCCNKIKKFLIFKFSFNRPRNKRIWAKRSMSYFFGFHRLSSSFCINSIMNKLLILKVFLFDLLFMIKLLYSMKIYAALAIIQSKEH